MKSFKEYLKEQPEEPAAPGAPIDVFFNNLDELTQKKIMEATMKELNVAEDDDYGNKKIVDGFAKVPLISLTGKDITNKIKFEV